MNALAFIVSGVIILQLIVLKAVHDSKAKSPMAVTELGIETEVKLEQPAKAAYPILVTELGMTIEFKFV